MNTQPLAQAYFASYDLAIEIDAPPPRVWRGLTDQLTSWWLPDFHVMGPTSTVVLERGVGGRLIESDGDRSLLWYTVILWEPGKSLSLSGFCTPAWGGPYTSLLSLELAESPGGSLLNVNDSLVGNVTEEKLRQAESGWRQLFADGLKKFVEAHD